MTRLIRAGLLAVALLLAGNSFAAAQNPDDPISRLNEALLHVMQNADTLGYQGRYDHLASVLDSVFDYPTMARFVIGSSGWQSLSHEQRADYIDHFRRMSIATYANQFSGYSGQSFELADFREMGTNQYLVRTSLLRPDEDAIALDYVVRLSRGGEYRAVDVLLGGRISQLSRQRSELSSVYVRLGFTGLLSELENAIESQATGG